MEFEQTPQAGHDLDLMDPEFIPLTDENFTALFNMVAEMHANMNRVIAIANEVSEKAGPLLETIEKSPILKMMKGF